MCPVTYCKQAIDNVFSQQTHTNLLHCALAAAQCIVVGPVCL